MTCSIPACLAMAWAVAGMSPVNMITSSPIFFRRFDSAYRIMADRVADSQQTSQLAINCDINWGRTLLAGIVSRLLG